MNALDDYKLTPEEVLTPPKVDMVGYLLMSLLATIIGLVVGILVFVLAFLFLGNFSLQSGVSPILVAMITFFALVGWNMLYVWWLTAIFPHIFNRTRTLFVQVSLFSVLLYVAVSVVYLVTSSLIPTWSGILGIYALHIALDVFWLVTLLGILSSYRYSLLFFYSSFVSFLLVGVIAFLVTMMLSTSSGALFTLMIFAGVTFASGTLVPFGILALYRSFYTLSGYDPLGDVFAKIQQEEKDAEKAAETLLVHNK